MKYQVSIGNQQFELLVENHGGDVRLFYGGKPVVLDLSPVDPAGFYSLIVDGKQYTLWIDSAGKGKHRVWIDHRPLTAVVEDERTVLKNLLKKSSGGRAGIEEVKAPMPGLVVDVIVQPGQEVKAGQGLVIIEAMKMENEIRSPVDGKVKQIRVEKGAAVEKDTVLLDIEAS
jgi:pyruvate carboxylase subunit B